MYEFTKDEIFEILILTETDYNGSDGNKKICN
jgi:hypothetical protein